MLFETWNGRKFCQSPNFQIVQGFPESWDSLEMSLICEDQHSYFLESWTSFGQLFHVSNKILLLWLVII